MFCQEISKWCKMQHTHIAGPVSELGHLIAEYADRVEKDGFFLEVIDAALFAEMHKKDLYMAVDWGTNEVGNADYIWKYLSTMLPRDFESTIPETNKASKSTWCLLSCNSLHSSDPHAVKNHYVPAYFKEQLSESEFLEFTMLAQSKAREKLSEHKAQLRELEESNDSWFENVEACSIASDLQLQVMRLLGSMICSSWM